MQLTTGCVSPVVQPSSHSYPPFFPQENESGTPLAGCLQFAKRDPRIIELLFQTLWISLCQCNGRDVDKTSGRTREPYPQPLWEKCPPPPGGERVAPLLWEGYACTPPFPAVSDRNHFSYSSNSSRGFLYKKTSVPAISTYKTDTLLTCIILFQNEWKKNI